MNTICLVLPQRFTNPLIASFNKDAAEGVILIMTRFLQKSRGPQEAHSSERTRSPWQNVFEKEVNMTRKYSKQINHRTSAHQDGKEQKHPGQIRGSKGKQAQKAHVDILVSTSP